MEKTETLLELATTYFLLINPIGNSPAILALVKNFEFSKQKKIMLREGIFAFLVALIFQFLGEHFLSMLKIKQEALTLCGGTLLFLVALSMIFSKSKETEANQPQVEPFLVPIAIPLLSGPGLLTIIMLTAAKEPSTLKITGAITVASIGVTATLLAAPYLQRWLGKKGLAALEQIMGMILALMAVEMILKGSGDFIKTLGA